MKKLTTFAFCFDLLMASTAFGALFMSSLGFIVKVFLGATVILLAGILELQGIQRSLTAEAGAKLNEVGFRFLESRINQTESGSLHQAYEKYLSEEHILNIARGEGNAYALMICIKFALWLGGGALMANYLLPELLKKYL